MNRHGRISIIFASLAFPLALLISSTAAWYLKSHNPDNVDVTAGLAYLRPILLSAFVTFGLCMVLSLWFALWGKRHDNSPELSYLGILLIIVVTLVTLASAIAQRGAGNAEESYRKQQSEALFRSVNAIDDVKRP